MRRRDPDELYEEVAFVAYHFGWDHETVLELPHRERERWVEEISAINERMNEHGRAPAERDPLDSDDVDWDNTSADFLS